MTTPANPTPEPTPICDAEEHVLKQMGQPEGLITVGTGRDLERQLSGTRRRLAEVEKERDEQNVTIETLTKHHRSCMDSRNAYAQNAAKAGVTIAEQKAKLTALLNAADGVLSALQEAERGLRDPIYQFNNDSADLIECRACGESAPLDKLVPFGEPKRPIEHQPECALLAVQAAIKKHAALISEGNQPSSDSNSPTASRESQG